MTKKHNTSEPKPSKQWTVAIYMVVDGPSGSPTLDRIAMSEVLSIINAANTANHHHAKVGGSGINVVTQVDLLEPKGLLQVTVSGKHGLNLMVPDEMNDETGAATRLPPGAMILREAVTTS